MSFLKKIKPKFWDHHNIAIGPDNRTFSLRRKWKLIVLLTVVICLFPMGVKTLVDYYLTSRTLESEMIKHISGIVSSTQRAVSLYLEQEKSVLNFMIQDNLSGALKDQIKTVRLLEDMTQRINTSINMGMLDSKGEPWAATRPGSLPYQKHEVLEWFKNNDQNSIYISDVRKAGNDIIYYNMAQKIVRPHGPVYFFLTAQNADPLTELLSTIQVDETLDIFMINQKGFLMTQSRFNGDLLEQLGLVLPFGSVNNEVIELKNRKNETLFLGYAAIPGTNFILVVTRPKSVLANLWVKPRLQLIGFLVFGIAIVLFVILYSATYLINRIHAADKLRLATLHKAEQVNKLASIGRLSSGVAHEINNPLAIIDQKAGLLKDLLDLRGNLTIDEKLTGLVDSILLSVQRCGEITRRLLDFARHMDMSIQKINLYEIIEELLSFMKKEADRRNIDMIVDIPEDFPDFECDRGKLQQIFLNLFNNAFSAMEKNGRLSVQAKSDIDEGIIIKISDTGHGISEIDIKHIFEPFFSTKSSREQPGLGLSIVYGLVRELGGDIAVESELGNGTEFIVTIPVKTKQVGRK